MSESFPKRITEPFSYFFSVARTGPYAITITARCRSGDQIGQYGGEDLRVEIDGVTFREIPELARKQADNTAASWNGTTLKGLSKTIIFIAGLKVGEHTLHFVPYRGAEITSKPSIDFIDNARQITFSPNIQAEDGDRRPWYAIVLVQLPLVTLTIEATAVWRKNDGDDIKLIVDGKTKENRISMLRRFWYWLGSLFKKAKPERQEHAFEENLKPGVHYMELWADRQPTLHKIILDVGHLSLTDKNLIKGKRIPTVDDPAWTGDFADDTEQMILARAIFGEARNELLSDAARIGVGWSIRRRVEDRRGRWGKTYNAVITQPKQYSAFNEKEKDNRPFVENPFLNNLEANKRMWPRCYSIAGQVMRGEVTNPTNGANHYHDISLKPYWIESAQFLIQIDTVRFYKL